MPERTGLRGWRELAPPIAIFALALALRLAFVEEHPPGLYLSQDMSQYDAMAHRLLGGDVARFDAFMPVGYPAFLALLLAAGGGSYGVVGLVQALLGAATAVLVYWIARRVSGSLAAGIGAGLALSLYEPLVFYAGLALTETLFSFLVTLSAALLLRTLERRGRATTIGAGIALGLGAVVRPNLLLAFPLLLGVAAVARRLSRNGERLHAPILLALACALGPVAVVAGRNTHLTGRATGLATNGGVNFFLGHCDCAGVRFSSGSVREVRTYTNRKHGEGIVTFDGAADDERILYGAALDLIVDDPTRVLRAAEHVVDGLGLGAYRDSRDEPYWPGWMGHDAELRAFGRGIAWLAMAPVALWFAVLAGRRALFDREGLPRLVVAALLASVLLTFFVFFGDPRLRVSFDPLLIALAAEAWTAAIVFASNRPRSNARRASSSG